MKDKKQILFWIITIAITLGLIDFASFIAGFFLLKRHGNTNRLKLYHPSFVPELQAGENAYQEYLKNRDHLLGWPSRTYLKKKDIFNEIGARKSTFYSNSNKNKPCISLYGDSFTFSDEVEKEYAWGNILADLIKCRVDNFGVNGYGTDQAFLRYKNNIHENSDIVILGIFIDNVPRNVNHFRRFLNPYTGRGKATFSFKPRFIKDGINLKLITIPEIAPYKFRNFLYNPEKYLKHEYFLPCSSPKFTCFKFPYTFSLIEAVFKKVKSKNVDHNFLSPSHPSRALTVTTLIVEEFVKLAISKKQQPLILLIPRPEDLKKYQIDNKWEYQSLIESLATIENTVVFNSGEYFINYLNGRNPTKILYFSEKQGRLLEHFNERSYRVLAEYVNRELSAINQPSQDGESQRY